MLVWKKLLSILEKKDLHKIHLKSFMIINLHYENEIETMSYYVVGKN